MANRLKTYITILIVILMTSVSAYALPNIPKEDIPKDISAKLRKQIERLYSHDPEVRASAIRKIGNMGEKALPATPFLLDMFNDGTDLEINEINAKTTIAEEAIFAFYNIGDSAVDLLINALDNDDATVSIGAAWALGLIGSPRSIKPIIKVMKNEDETVQFFMVFSFREMAPNLLRNKEAHIVVPDLITILMNEEGNLKEIAAWLLGIIGDPRAIKPLVNELNNKNEKDRKNAAEALGWLCDRNAVEPLLMALYDPESKVQEAAAEALGIIRNKHALNRFIGGLKKRDIDIQNEAAIELNKIKVESIATTPVAWKKWWKAQNAPK